MVPETLRDTVRERVGWRGASAPVTTATVSARAEPWGIVEEVLLGGQIPGTIVRPAAGGPHPAVLYCHAHGFQYGRGRSELLNGAKSLSAPWGPELAALGFVALAIDLSGFGARQSDGTESALAKAHLWRGQTLFGAMLADLSAALNVLRDRPDVDAERLFTVGLSMGAMHAMWLGALDERIKGVIQLCVLADLGPLIADGAHDLHAPYLTVPGLLEIAEMGDVAGLVSPRAQFIGLGAHDPLTPERARNDALARVQTAYGHQPHALVIHLEPDAGHVETPDMRAAAIRFLTAAAFSADAQHD